MKGIRREFWLWRRWATRCAASARSPRPANRTTKRAAGLWTAVVKTARQRCGPMLECYTSPGVDAVMVCMTYERMCPGGEPYSLGLSVQWHVFPVLVLLYGGVYIDLMEAYPVHGMGEVFPTGWVILIGVRPLHEIVFISPSSTKNCASGAKRMAYIDFLGRPTRVCLGTCPLPLLLPAAAVQIPISIHSKYFFYPPPPRDCHS